MSLSVRARLTLFNVTAVAILILLLGIAVSLRVREHLMGRLDADLRERSERLVGVLGAPPMGMPLPGPRASPGAGPGFDRPPHRDVPRPGPVLVAEGPLRPRVFDPDGRSGSQFADETPWDESAVAKARRDRAAYSTLSLDGEEYRVYTRTLGPDRPGWTIQYANPTADTLRAIGSINQTLLAFAPLSLLIAALVGHFLTLRALKPVGDIASAAGRITGQSLSERLPARGADEFAQLAKTMNSMLDRLESSFRSLEEAIEQQRRFTADASHELRTPLTTIKANTSLALSAVRSASEYRLALEEIDRAATRMSGLVQDLLILARADAGKQSTSQEPVDVEAVLKEAIARTARDDKPAIESATSNDPTIVRGDREALVRLFENLLGNAIRHTPEEGSVRVEARREGPMVAIRVRDTGEGIAPEHLPHLGERFYRVDEARARAHGGVGLGLAICRSIAQAHGGSIEFESRVGTGTTVTVRLPAEP